MQINITDQQKQQIMQTPEFVAKLSELMAGFKPTINSMPDGVAVAMAHIAANVPFADIKFRNDDYNKLITGDPYTWDGITLQKFCMIAQTFTASALQMTSPAYFLLMAFTQSILEQIDSEVSKQRETAIKAVFLAFKAKNSIIQ